MDEINEIIGNTRLKNYGKYGRNCERVNIIKSNVQFLDTVKKKTKNITINSCNVNKRQIASLNRHKFIEVSKLTIKIEGDIDRSVFETYMKRDNVPMLWINFFRDCKQYKLYKQLL